MNYKTFILVLCMAAWSQTFATRQVPDILDHEQQSALVHQVSLPAEAASRLSVWTKHERIVGSSASHDGFSAQMSIKEGFLFIDRILVVDFGDTKVRRELRPVPMKFIFEADGPVKATWFTGQLYEFLGEPLDVNTHVSPRFRVFYFESGKLLRTTVEEVK